MARALTESGKIEIRLRPEDKRRLTRAVALKRLVLSERDSLRVLELLEHPPQPNAKLLAAAKALPLQP